MALYNKNSLCCGVSHWDIKTTIENIRLRPDQQQI